MKRTKQRNGDYSGQEGSYGKGMSRSRGLRDRSLQDEDFDDFDDQYDEDDVEDVEFGNRRLLGGRNRNERWNQGMGDRGQSGYRENEERGYDYWSGRHNEYRPQWYGQRNNPTWDDSSYGERGGRDFGNDYGRFSQRVDDDWRRFQDQPYRNDFGQYGDRSYGQFGRGSTYGQEFGQQHFGWQHGGQANAFDQPYGQSQGSRQDWPYRQQQWNRQGYQYNPYGQFGNAGQHNQSYWNQQYGPDRRHERGYGSFYGQPWQQGYGQGRQQGWQEPWNQPRYENQGPWGQHQQGPWGQYNQGSWGHNDQGYPRHWGQHNQGYQGQWDQNRGQHDTWEGQGEYGYYGRGQEGHEDQQRSRGPWSQENSGQSYRDRQGEQYGSQYSGQFDTEMSGRREDAGMSVQTRFSNRGENLWNQSQRNEKQQQDAAPQSKGFGTTDDENSKSGETKNEGQQPGRLSGPIDTRNEEGDRDSDKLSEANKNKSKK